MNDNNNNIMMGPVHVFTKLNIGDGLPFLNTNLVENETNF